MRSTRTCPIVFMKFYFFTRLKQVKLCKLQAVQEVASTPQGAYIDVRDQGAHSYDAEMRRRFLIFRLDNGFAAHIRS